MFHVFGDVYLDVDAAFTTLRYGNITISSRWSKIDFLDPSLKMVRVYNSFDDFAKEYLAGDKSKIWSYLNATKPQGTRYVLYVEPYLYQTLQIQYWKSILKMPTAETVYNLHKMYTQDCWMKSHLYDEYASEEGRKAYRELPLWTREQFDEVYESTAIATLLHKMSKTNVSFEYQLADYLRDPTTSKLEKAVLDKVGRFTRTNWVQELEVLKADLINAGYDVNEVLPDGYKVDTSDPIALNASISANKYLQWMVDPNIHYSNPEYVEQTYDREIFKHLYTRTIAMWGAQEDMSELIELIYNHNYHELLLRDISRRFGCVYGAGRYRLRMNQVFLSWIYGVVRAQDVMPLDVYELA